MTYVLFAIASHFDMKILYGCSLDENISMTLLETKHYTQNKKRVALTLKKELLKNI